MQDRRKVIDLIKQAQIVLVFLGMIMISALISDRFLSRMNLMNILRQVSVNGILACGMTFVMLTGGFDLSVGAVVTITGATALKLQGALGVWGAIGVAILVGVACGTLNGLILSKIKAGSGDAFMITLGSQFVIFGASLLIYEAKFIPASKDAFYNFLGTGNVGLVPVPLIIFASVAVLWHLVLRYTDFGRNVYFTGGNYEAACLSGVHAGFHKAAVYAILGAMAAIAAVVLTSRSGGCSSDIGAGYELDAIAAVMVGGTSTVGGEGNIARTVLGVFIIGVLANILNLMGMSSFNQMVAKGIVVVLAVWLDKSRRNL